MLHPTPSYATCQKTYQESREHVSLLIHYIMRVGIGPRNNILNHIENGKTLFLVSNIKKFFLFV